MWGIISGLAFNSWDLCTYSLFQTTASVALAVWGRESSILLHTDTVPGNNLWQAWETSGPRAV